MVIVETSIFTGRVLDIPTDDEYGELQGFMAAHPDAGNIMPGSHGLRKLRWRTRGGRKRGGTRIIYDDPGLCQFRTASAFVELHAFVEFLRGLDS